MDSIAEEIEPFSHHRVLARARLDSDSISIESIMLTWKLHTTRPICLAHNLKLDPLFDELII